MPKQTFISCYYKNENDKMYVDFNRWGYKKPETILKKILDFIKEYPLLCKEWNTIKIFATPDGYNAEETPILIYNNEKKDKK